MPKSNHNRAEARFDAGARAAAASLPPASSTAVAPSAPGAFAAFAAGGASAPVSASALSSVAASLLAPSSSSSSSSSLLSSSSSAARPLKPSFPALGAGAGAAAAAAAAAAAVETRSVRVPPNRYTPLREQWDAVVAPCVEHLKLMIRMNAKKRAVELRNSAFTTEAGALQKGEDFVRAFMLGFDVSDAVALLRLDDVFVESFEVTDVKPLKGDHLSRAIGRIAGQGGKTKFTIENATRTRVVVQEQKVHILGAFANIQVARDALCALILGSPPGKVFNSMRNVSARMGSR